MRRGFTLIELLVVVAVVAAMLGAAVLSVSTGTQSARLRNAVRGVKQFGRHARAMALLRQAPYVMTVSEVWKGGDFVKSRIEVKGTAATSGAARGGGTMKDVTGKYVGGEDGGDVETASSLANLGEEPKEYEGVRIKIEMLADDGRSKQRERSGVSVFSNVDFLRGMAAQAQPAAEEGDKNPGGSEDEAREPVSVIYETNGRCRPYLVTVYADGQDEDKGQKIRFDRFGGVHEEEDK